MLISNHFLENILDEGTEVSMPLKLGWYPDPHYVIEWALGCGSHLPDGGQDRIAPTMIG